METVVLPIVVLVAGTLVTWWGSVRLEASAGRLSRRYRLPAVVQGTLVVAVGSSFPELSTTVLSILLHGEFQLGMATIVGSAIFNILVIPAVTGLTGEPAEHGLRLVYRDAQFYLTSVAVLLLAFSFALIYHPAGPGSAGGGATGAGTGGLTGTLTRPLAVVPLLLYGLYLFLQEQDVAEERAGDVEGKRGAGVRPAVRLAGIGASGTPGRDLGRLLLGLVTILVGVEALLRSVLALGDRFGIPSFLWGVTVVAAATSLPDAVVSHRAARRGEEAVSLGNVLGSNIFDLLVAVPLGVLVAGGAVVDFTVAAPLMAMLTVATVALFATMRTGVILSRREAWLLLGLYALFLAWAVGEGLGVVDLVGR